MYPQHGVGIRLLLGTHKLHAEDFSALVSPENITERSAIFEGIDFYPLLDVTLRIEVCRLAEPVKHNRRVLSKLGGYRDIRLQENL